MYRTFYSLSQIPFSKEIDTNDAFSSSQFQDATSALKYIQNTRGIGLITGEPGAGKTFVLRAFKDSLNPALYYPVYFQLSTGNVMDFYRGLAYELGEIPRYQKVNLFRQIQSGIQSMSKDRKITPVIILDEMHLAKDAFLQDVALLFNFEMDSSNPYILILSGMPHLKVKLRMNQHTPLSQRITAKYEFQPLSKAETVSYIEHHMKLAGAHMPIFSENALEAIHVASQGWPRMINKIATNSLLFGAQKKVQLIDEVIVRMAAEESMLL